MGASVLFTDIILFSAWLRNGELGVSSWSLELELESGVRGQGSGSGVGVQSWSCKAKLAVERRSERADTAYSPRFREEEPSATADKRNWRWSECPSEGIRRIRRGSPRRSLRPPPTSETGGGAKVRARGFGVFAEGSPRRSLRPPPRSSYLRYLQRLAALERRKMCVDAGNRRLKRGLDVAAVVMILDENRTDEVIS